MSRNHVATLFAGIDTANTNAAQIDLDALTEGQIIAYDPDTGVEVAATSTKIAFARGTAVLGEPLVSGIIPIAGITSAILNPYNAPVNKEMTLTFSAVPDVGKSCTYRISYHDNLSIIPNQIKQTTISVFSDAANTASTTTWAAAVAAAFNAQVDGNLFCSVTPAANVITFVGLTLTTQSNYNGIDRPEVLNFEIGTADGDGTAGVGTSVVATSVALESGQGDASKVAWMEEQAMGRQGFSDRRMWNNTKKYPSQVVAGETYDVLVINADYEGEGDMQGTRKYPIGAVICGQSDTLALILVDLARAGVVPVTVAA